MGVSESWIKQALVRVFATLVAHGAIIEIKGVFWSCSAERRAAGKMEFLPGIPFG
jgi:hypothetical protein